MVWCNKYDESYLSNSPTFIAIVRGFVTMEKQILRLIDKVWGDYMMDIIHSEFS